MARGPRSSTLPGRPRLVRSRPGTWSLALSVVAHVALLGVAGVVAFRSIAEREAREHDSIPVAPPLDAITIELPTVAEGTLLADKEDVPEGTKPTAYGGATVARVDTGTPGAGGQATG